MLHINKNELDIKDKLILMQEDAKYEVGSDNDAERTALLCADRIKGAKTPPKVPKTFLASSCIFNCAYCGCRCSREERHNYVNTPLELAELSLAAAKDNGHGIFITSAIYKNADYTQELLAETARILREDLYYKGYLHIKVMPGAASGLIERSGKYADRLSVNIEVAKASGYERIAKQKNKANILTPMQDISDQIYLNKLERKFFATSQTTQLMAGSTYEDDRTIMVLSKALYKKYRMARVYYTAFHYNHPVAGYDSLPVIQTPYWRMARLYQADRLMQLYGFAPEDILPEFDPYLKEDIDPKAAWALRHLDMYPVEINTADYETLLRIPGIGLTYAKRIIEARRYRRLTHDMLKMMKISLKRSNYFITCSGRYKGGAILESSDIKSVLLSAGQQMSIFQSLTDQECSQC